MQPNNFGEVVFQPVQTVKLSSRRRSTVEHDLADKNSSQIKSKRDSIKSQPSFAVTENNGSTIIKQETKVQQPQQENNQLLQESKVGKQLSDLTARRVIILVLAMLISAPIFSDTTFQDDDNSFKIGISLIKNYDRHSSQFNMILKSIIETESA